MTLTLFQRMLTEAGVPIVGCAIVEAEHATDTPAHFEPLGDGSFLRVDVDRGGGLTAAHRAKIRQAIAAAPDWAWGHLEVADDDDAALEPRVQRVPLKKPVRRSDLPALLARAGTRWPTATIAFVEDL